MSLEKKNIGLLGSVKNENYINILKIENTELDNKLKKVNELVSKLKSQITKNEQEKNLLISNSYQKDKDLEIIKKQLEQTKSQVDELKNQKKISSLVEENNILQKNKEINVNTIAELQQKITDLEFKLKASSSSLINTKFSILSGAHNFSLVIQGSQKKSSKELPDILSVNNIGNNKVDNNNFFLTGKNELIEMKENNKKLQEQLDVLQNEINKHETDKLNMIKELEQYNKEKNNLLNTLNKKNEEINGKLNKENELNNNLMKQLIENKKIKNNLDNIKTKCQNLEKNKKELEDVIFQQENKVNELSSSVKKIINIVKMKNIEINNNKIYINNLEETIKDLNKEFHQIRLKKKKDNSQDILNLKNQLENLKKEYQKLIEYNNSIDINRQMVNFNHISNNHIISRNYNINNFNNNESNKIKIKNLNNNISNNKMNYSSLNISNLYNNNDQRGKRVNSQKNIYDKGMSYDMHKEKKYQNNNYSNKNNGINIDYKFPNFNQYNINHSNMRNLNIHKFGNLRYDSSLNQIKKRIKNKSIKDNISLQNIKRLKLKDEKYMKNESEGKDIKKIKIKKINSIVFKNKLYDCKKIDTADKIMKNNDNNINNINSKSSNLLQKQIGLVQKERIEKQKIEEFKSLLEQIVNDIEN